jgi:intracellular multiplication protein IcmK
MTPFISYADSFLDQTLPDTSTTTGTANSTAQATPTSSTESSDTNSAAFQQLLNSYFPLTPDQIHQFKNATAVQQEANAAPPGNSPPEGTSSIIPVTLKPGGVMPVIRVGRGMITSLVITDASGQVWPITSYSIGDPSSFAVQWDKASGVLMIQGQKLYAQTNIGIMLQGLQIPVMLTLLIGQNNNWDYLDYVQLDQNQPGDTNTPQPVSQAPAYLVDLLNGIPPPGASQLVVSDSNAAQVWSYGGQYIMLTKATLLSPAWTSRANGPGPTPYHAYALSPAPEVLISNMGNLEKLLVNNPGSQDDQSDQ